LNKVTTYSKRIDKKAVAEAGFVDFSKSVEDQDVRNELDDDDPRKHVSKFPVPCYNCDKMGNVQMCFSSIPFFKEIVLMCFSCDFCGYRNSEIKEGGGMGEKGKKITLQVNEDIDLNRDLFKSNTASFVIPEIGFDMEAGTLGSCFTTVEGLLMKAHEELEKNNPFGRGDSKNDEKFLEFLAKLKKCQTGETPCTLILDDPADNCFVYNPFAPKEDPKLKIERYERS
jgi:zinc finger protein